jgi:hypothetical protein
MSSKQVKNKKPPQYSKTKPAKPKKAIFTCIPKNFHNTQLPNRDIDAGVKKNIPRIA